jgi:hypothetical protein
VYDKPKQIPEGRFISGVSQATHEEAREGALAVSPTPEPEPFQTLADAADQIGLPTFKIRRAAKRGLFPTYTLLNGRKLALVSEIRAAIRRSRSVGGPR